jgi:hypothetical protein
VVTTVFVNSDVVVNGVSDSVPYHVDTPLFANSDVVVNIVFYHTPILLWNECHNVPLRRASGSIHLACFTHSIFNSLQAASSCLYVMLHTMCHTM